MRLWVCMFAARRFQNLLKQWIDTRNSNGLIHILHAIDFALNIFFFLFSTISFTRSDNSVKCKHSIIIAFQGKLYHSSFRDRLMYVLLLFSIRRKSEYIFNANWQSIRFANSMNFVAIIIIFYSFPAQYIQRLNFHLCNSRMGKIILFFFWNDLDFLRIGSAVLQ